MFSVKAVPGTGAYPFDCMTLFDQSFDRLIRVQRDPFCLREPDKSGDHAATFRVSSLRVKAPIDIGPRFPGREPLRDSFAREAHRCMFPFEEQSITFILVHAGDHGSTGKY